MKLSTVSLIHLQPLDSRVFLDRPLDSRTKYYLRKIERQQREMDEISKQMRSVQIVDENWGGRERRWMNMDETANFT